jgi:5-amino-6-(5-phosphoribosylamino)uracil reductase
VPAPHVLVSCAISLDGCLDDASGTRLVLSHPDDLDRVDAIRASCDAILVGANTVRRDDPRLLVRSEARVSQRVAEGRSPQPLRVTLTRSGNLDPQRAFFRPGSGECLVFAGDEAERLAAKLGDAATVVAMPGGGGVASVLDELGRRGIARLLVEGGATVLTQFLAGDLVDELRVAVAPFFVGDPVARRVVGASTFPFGAARRMPLADVEHVGDMAVATYRLRVR